MLPHAINHWIVFDKAYFEEIKMMCQTNVARTDQLVHVYISMRHEYGLCMLYHNSQYASSLPGIFECVGNWHVIINHPATIRRQKRKEMVTLAKFEFWNTIKNWTHRRYTIQSVWSFVLISVGKGGQWPQRHHPPFIAFATVAAYRNGWFGVCVYASHARRI